MRNNPREVLLALHRRHVGAWERKNIDEMRDLYAEEAVIFHTEPPSRFSDFKTFENNLIQYFSSLGEYSFLSSNIQIELAEGMGWVTSLYMRVHREGEQMVRQNGRWTEVYTRVGEDHWKLVHFHASVDPG